MRWRMVVQESKEGFLRALFLSSFDITAARASPRRIDSSSSSMVYVVTQRVDIAAQIEW